MQHAFVTHCRTSLVLDASGAAWLPASRTLLLADLHFEKASWFASHLQFLPPYDTAVTCAAIRGLLARYRAERVVCLGDSFHDVHAEARMEEEDRSCLGALVGSVAEWVWVTGNHDPVAPQSVGGRSTPSLLLDGFRLVHEPERDSAEPQICGHFHPKARLRMAGLRLNAPSFVLGPSVMILPSFGALTGGLDIRHPAIQAWVGDAPRLYLCHRQRLFALENGLPE